MAVPLAVIVLAALALFGGLKYRNRRKEKAMKEEQESSEDNQPYLQRKGELDAEEKIKYELQAEERRYELGDESETREMSTTKDHDSITALSRQELRGEEHSRELECPEN